MTGQAPEAPSLVRLPAADAGLPPGASIVRAVTSWRGVHAEPHPAGGTLLLHADDELGHLFVGRAANGLGRERIQAELQLDEDGSALAQRLDVPSEPVPTERRTRPGEEDGERLRLSVRDRSDADDVIRLFRLAYEHVAGPTG